MLALVLVLAAAVIGGIALSERGTIPAGTTIAGVDVGGMTRDEAAAAVLPVAQARVTRSIRLIGPRGEARVSGRALGARPLLDPALDTALAAGPGERLLRHAGIGAAEAIAVVYRLGPVRAAELANRLDRRFGEQPRNAGLVVDGGVVSVSAPAPGTLVDRGALRQGLRTLPSELGVPLRRRGSRRSASPRRGSRSGRRPGSSTGHARCGSVTPRPCSRPARSATSSPRRPLRVACRSVSIPRDSGWRSYRGSAASSGSRRTRVS